jgi:heme A synthase
MINLLITIIIFAIVAGLLYWLITLLPIPEPFKTIITVCSILVCVLLVLGIFFGAVDVPALRLR